MHFTQLVIFGKNTLGGKNSGKIVFKMYPHYFATRKPIHAVILIVGKKSSNQFHWQNYYHFTTEIGLWKMIPQHRNHSMDRFSSGKIMQIGLENKSPRKWRKFKPYLHHFATGKAWWEKFIGNFGTRKRGK